MDIFEQICSNMTNMIKYLIQYGDYRMLTFNYTETRNYRAGACLPFPGPLGWREQLLFVRVVRDEND